MTEFLLIVFIVFFILAVATNCLYIYLLYKADRGEELMFVKPPAELLRPWTKTTNKGKKPKINDDERAYDVENREV